MSLCNTIETTSDFKVIFCMYKTEWVLMGSYGLATSENKRSYIVSFFFHNRARNRLLLTIFNRYYCVIWKNVLVKSVHFIMNFALNIQRKYIRSSIPHSINTKSILFQLFKSSIKSLRKPTSFDIKKINKHGWKNILWGMVEHDTGN